MSRRVGLSIGPVLLVLPLLLSGCELLDPGASRRDDGLNAQDQQIEMLMRQLEDLKSSSHDDLCASCEQVKRWEDLLKLEEAGDLSVEERTERLGILLAELRAETDWMKEMKEYMETSRKAQGECAWLLGELTRCRHAAAKPEAGNVDGGAAK